MMSLFKNFFISLTMLCFLTSCSTSQANMNNKNESDRDDDNAVANPISVGTMIQLNEGNIMKYLSFKSSYAEENRASINKPSFIDVNVGFDIDATFYYQTKYFASNEDYSNRIYTEYYSSKCVNFKSTKLEESVFNQNKEFVYTYNVLENTYDIEVSNYSTTLYRIEYNVKNIEGYGIFNEECYSLYSAQFDLNNFGNYFTIYRRKFVSSGSEGTFLCFSIYFLSSDLPNHPLFLSDLNVELEYASFNSDYTIKSVTKYTISSPFVIEDSFISLKITNDENWNIKVISISGICYKQSIHFEQ